MLKKFRSNKGFTLIELMIVVAIIGILAAVALPAFKKYQYKAKTSEAITQIDLIKKGSASYYSSQRTNATTGQKIECQFPAKVGTTPIGASCCVDDNDADNDEKCDSKPGAWNHTTWSALQFQMNDAHFFQYSYDSTGIYGAAKFTAEANADLDCDTTMSTFKYLGKGDTKATGAECDMVSSSSVESNLDTE